MNNVLPKIKVVSAWYVIFLLMQINLSTLSCQSVGIEGLVLDCTEIVRLPSASVVLYDTGSQTIVSYDISASDGSYSIRVDTTLTKGTNPNYQLVTSYIGYKSDTLALNFNSLDTPLNICLRKDAVLQTIEVTETRSGIEIIGDTIKYNVDIYKRPSDSNLRDVVSRLPGLTIDDEGEIKYGNQKIVEVQVDGDDFMNSNRTTLLDGFNAKNIESIKLFKDTQVDGYVLNIETGKELVLNVSTENFVGFGKNIRYLSDIYAYSFAPKLKLFYGGRANDVGIELLNFGDYIRQNGNVFSSNALSDVGRITKYVFDKPETYAKYRGLNQSLNWSYDASNRFKLSGFYGYFSSNRLSVSSSREILPNRIFEISQTERIAGRTSSHRWGLRGLYALPKIKLRFGANMNASKHKYENDSFREININIANNIFARENQTLENRGLSTYFNGTYKDSSVFIVFDISHQNNILDDERNYFSMDTLLLTRVIGFTSLAANQVEHRPFRQSNLVARLEKNIKRKYTLASRANVQINNWRDNYDITLGEQELTSDMHYVGITGTYEAGISKKHKSYELYIGFRFVKPFDKKQATYLFPSAKIEVVSPDRKKRFELLLNGNSEFSNFLLANTRDTFNIIRGLYELVATDQSEQKLINMYNAQLLYANINPLQGQATFVYSRLFLGDVETFDYISNDFLAVKSPSFIGENRSLISGFLYNKKSITSPFSVNIHGLADFSLRKLLFDGNVSSYTQRSAIIKSQLNYFFSNNLEFSSQLSFQNGQTKARESSINFSLLNFLIIGKFQTHRLGFSAELGTAFSIQNKNQSIFNTLLNFDIYWRLQKISLAIKGRNIFNIRSYTDFNTVFKNEVTTESTRTLLPGAIMLGIRFSINK